MNNKIQKHADDKQSCLQRPVGGLRGGVPFNVRPPALYVLGMCMSYHKHTLSLKEDVFDSSFGFILPPRVIYIPIF